MVLIFFVVWGCIGWGIVCYCAIKAGARRHAMESAPSAPHKNESAAMCDPTNPCFVAASGVEQTLVNKE